jgi:hypothetical protein
MTVTTPDNDPKAARQHRVQHWAVVVGAAATVLGTTFALLTYCTPDAGTGTAPGADRTVTAAPPGAPRTPSPPPPPSADRGGVTVDLSTLELYQGRSRLGELPRDRADDPALRDALVIECPSNQSDDQASEVTYATRLHYHTFRATVHAIHDAQVPVGVTVFPDPQDLLPGAAGGDEPPDEVTLLSGQTRDLEVDIEEAFYLRLRVRCESPGGHIALTGAEVER